MRVLYVCIQTPSPLASNGGGQAAFDYVSLLAQLCELDLVTTVERGAEALLEPLRGRVRQLDAIPWSSSLTSRALRYARSALADRSLSPFLNRPFLDAARERIEKGGYGLVQADWTEIARHLRTAPGTPFLCGAHDLRERLAERVWRAAGGPLDKRIAHRRWMRCRRQEVELFQRCAAVLTLSEADAHRAQALVPTTPAFPVVYKQAKPETVPPAWSERDARTLLYVGDYGRESNRRIARRILIDLLPALRRRLPGVELILAGARMPKALRTVARREGARVPGYLPSLDALYRRATLMLAPIDVGGGLHIKMLEALTHGLPVLTTSTGNDGLGAEPARSVWIADDDDALIEGCTLLLGDSALAEALGEAGREHVLARFGAERARSDLERVLGSVAS